MNVATIPSFASPFEWRLIAQLSDRDNAATRHRSDRHFAAANPSSDAPPKGRNLFALTVRVGPDRDILEEWLGP